ncbi:hypothetical protein [Robbsia sp. KACC 23696]|uniref:hypothetical protein n=1 Tax=Robbsia sp. KACC 23696 TaxID=3149231 RepID=UPI00325AE6AB
MSLTRHAQDEKLAHKILAFSATDIPIDLIGSRILEGYIGNAIDLRPYRANKGSIGLSKLEDNTGGRGGVLRAPMPQVRLISDLLQGIGRKLSTIESPLIVVASSDGPSSALGLFDRWSNPGIGEKIWVADQIADGFRREGRSSNVLGFRRSQWLSKQSDIASQRRDNPTIVVGYSNELHSAALHGTTHRSLLTVLEGEVFFSGRRVDCIINEQFAHYVQKKSGPIDCEKTLIGPMIDLGTNKALAYAAHNLFVSEAWAQARTQFPALAREITYATCESVEALIATAQIFSNLGLGCVCKPTGTNGGYGVIVVKPGQFDAVAFSHLVTRSIAEVARVYDRHNTVAGMPYVISEYIESPTIQVPVDMRAQYGHLDGCTYELQVDVCTREAEHGQKQFVALPSLFKIQGIESGVANASLQAARSGRPYDEFILPALNEDALRLTGISETLLHEAAKYSAAYQLHALHDLARTSTQFKAMKQRISHTPGLRPTDGSTRGVDIPSSASVHSSLDTRGRRPRATDMKTLADTLLAAFRRFR